jgi:hypothetical protein
VTRQAMGSTIVSPAAVVPNKWLTETSGCEFNSSASNFACPVHFSEETIKAAAKREEHPTLNIMYDNEKQVAKKMQGEDMPSEAANEYCIKQYTKLKSILRKV